ncbi:hypothetical protein KC361_g222 [Hortaea werneckii]|nr:hypothetical protein KC361_g222 [Hortaea werneckii]
MQSWNRHVDGACQQIRQHEQGQAVAVESLHDLARSILYPLHFRLLVLGLVDVREHHLLDGAEEEELTAVEGADPGDVGKVSHTPGDEEDRAIFPDEEHRQDEPKTSPLDQQPDVNLRELGFELRFRLRLCLFLGLCPGEYVCEPVCVFVERVILVLLAGRLLARPPRRSFLQSPGENTGADSHTGNEDTQIPNERIDTLAVL